MNTEEFAKLKQLKIQYESEIDIRSRVDKVESTLARIEEFLNKFFDTKIGNKDGTV